MRWILRLLVLVVLIIAGLLLMYGKSAFLAQDQVGSSMRFEVSTSTQADLPHALKDADIVDSAFGYRLYMLIDGAASRSKLGVYDVKRGSSYRDIARQLALGPTRNETQVTIIEGWTMREMSAALEKEEVDPKEFTRLAGASAGKAEMDETLKSQYTFLKDLPNGRSLEGYLFPDTYRVWKDQLPEGLIRKQLGEFERRYKDVEIPAKLAPLETLDDVVILASIVEKEVRDPQDRHHVAGLFLNRLKQGMALQSDATVSYITGSKRSRSTFTDLENRSPYNTYQHRGLPPGPVSSPGATAMEAVLDPDDTDDLYFLTDEAGKVYYAKTLQEHARNRVKAGF